MEPVRALRAFYSRPYFLPPMVEMSTRSLVAMATPIGDTSLGENHYKFLVRNFKYCFFFLLFMSLCVCYCNHTFRPCVHYT